MLRSFPATGPIDEDLAREGYILASFNGQEPQPVILESAGEIGTIRISTLRNAIAPSTRNFNLVTTVGTRQVHNPLSIVNDVTVYGFHAGYTYTFSPGVDVALEPLAAAAGEASGAMSFFFRCVLRGHSFRRALLALTCPSVPRIVFSCHSAFHFPTTLVCAPNAEAVVWRARVL